MYGQQPNWNNNKPVNDRDPYFKPGNGEAVILSLDPFNHQTHGPSFAMRFVIKSSNNPEMPPNSKTVQTFNLYRPSKYPATQVCDLDRLANAICAALGIQLGQHQQACNMVTKTAAEGGSLEQQPLRGIVVRFSASASKKAPEPGKDPYTNVAYAHVAGQTPEAIAAMRAWLDQSFGAWTPRQDLAPQQQQYGQPPQQYGQPPPAYGQPPPAYGQPPPQQPWAYQQPPAQAAPPPAYGQPQQQQQQQWAQPPAAAPAPWQSGPPYANAPPPAPPYGQPPSAPTYGQPPQPMAAAVAPPPAYPGVPQPPPAYGAPPAPPAYGSFNQQPPAVPAPGYGQALPPPPPMPGYPPR